MELERKIEEARLAADNTIPVPVLCGNGFHRHQDRLDDFVAFYSTGMRVANDLFSLVEHKHMADKKISLKRTISRFAHSHCKQGREPPKLGEPARPARDGL